MIDKQQDKINGIVIIVTKRFSDSQFSMMDSHAISMSRNGPLSGYRSARVIVLATASVSVIHQRDRPKKVSTLYADKKCTVTLDIRSSFLFYIYSI